MRYELILNKDETIDITNDIINNSFVEIARCDEVFGSGTLDFENKTINKNIPPYTLLHISDDTYNKYWCASSEATLNMISQTYFHHCELLDATCLLSRFVVGSKAFSVTGTNKLDKDKVNILIELMNQKYDVVLSCANEDLLYEEKEFVFGAGTTLYDCLVEIAKQYNRLPFVVEVWFDANNKLNIAFEFRSLISNTYKWVANRVLSLTQTQNSDNYCYYLESEATNVIDRTNMVKVDNLVLKADSVKVDEDNAKIELPTKAEQVLEFGITNIPASLVIAFAVKEAKGTGMKTYGEWAKLYPDLNTIYDEIISKYVSDKDLVYNNTAYKYEMLYVAEENQYLLYLYNNIYETKMRQSLTKYLLAKEKWDLLTDDKKPRYAYYQTGTNIIDGINNYYKTDLWNEIIGSSVKSFMKDFDIDVQNKYVGEKYGEVTIDVFKLELINESPYNNIFNNIFYAEYIPITNPFLVDKKSSLPTNEEDWKPYALTYNKSSNYIDLDKIVNSMQMENNSIGREELILTYDMLGTTMPRVSQMLNIDDINWYIKSMQTTFGTHSVTSIINLVRNCNKKADVIGLNTQYNTTKNPFENIIERPIFCESNDAITLTNGNCYLMLNRSGLSSIYKPVTLMQQGNVVYAYCEALDFYSFDKKVEHVSGSIYTQKDVKYVNDYNELESTTISLVELLDDLRGNATDGVGLPYYTGAKNVLFSKTLKIYKDAREKLTFTIKLNNCIIK